MELDHQGQAVAKSVGFEIVGKGKQNKKNKKKGNVANTIAEGDGQSTAEKHTLVVEENLRLKRELAELQARQKAGKKK